MQSDPTQARFLIIGAGQAGAALAARLRALGHAGPLTLVGAEPDAPYQRPPLSKAYLKREIDAERLHLRPPSFYAAEGIALVTGTEVAAIDRAARIVRLSDGSGVSGSLARSTAAVGSCRGIRFGHRLPRASSV